MTELRSDHSVFFSMFDSNADGVIVLSHNQAIVYWNPIMEQLTGRRLSEILNKPVSEVLKISEKASFTANITNSFQGKGQSGRRRYTLEGKEAFSCYITFSPCSLPGKSDSYSLLQLRILTESPRPGGIESLIKDSPLPMSVYARNGDGVYLNKAYAEMWDVPFSLAERVFSAYNILKDDQLSAKGIQQLLDRAFDGEVVELPVLSYNPMRTSSLIELDLDEKKFLKGYLFPWPDSDPGQLSVIMIVQDMTEQMRSEEELRDNQLKFRMLSLGVPGIIYEYHIPFEEEPFFNYISDGVKKIFGLSPDTVQADANRLFSLAHPNDKEDLYKALNSPDQADQYWVWSGRFLIDGKTKWVEAKSSPGIIKEDKIIRYGLIMDITDRKSIEDAHKRTEERLRIALEAADIGIWEWDVNERRKIFNMSWLSRFGYGEDEAELLYNNWEKLIHPDDLPEVKKKLSRYLKKQVEIFEAEYRFFRADGTFRWILERGSGVAMDQGGKIIRATGTIVDIHEKKANENEIKRQEQLFSHLFSNAPVGIVFLDEKLIVRQVNPGFSEIFGYSADDIEGKELDHRIVPDDLLEESKTLNRFTRSGRPQKLETYRLNADNEPVPVIIYSIPVIFQKQTIGIYGLYVDITDRVKAEKELEVRNLELDNFVYKVSHDLRAPLSSIMGLVNIVNQERGSDSVYDYIDMIENRIKQLDHFISDILSHSKNLKLDVNYSKIDFHEIIEECFNSISYLPQTSKIKKIINIRGCDFYSDQWRINEILRNLISNAVKYYSTRRDEPFIEIDILVERTYAAIYFGDNGIGITEDRAPKVFEMFYRATEHGEGSGIGLYIVKNAIERLGGVIRLRSEANKGTSFEITLPNAIREIDEENTG